MNIHKNAALVLIDMQDGINHPKLGRRNNPQAEAQMSMLLAAWRETRRPVIHVRHFFPAPRIRCSGPSNRVSNISRRFDRLRASGS